MISNTLPDLHSRKVWQGICYPNSSHSFDIFWPFQIVQQLLSLFVAPLYHFSKLTYPPNSSTELQNPQLKVFVRILAVLKKRVYQYLNQNLDLKTAKILAKAFNWGFCRSVQLVVGGDVRHEILRRFAWSGHWAHCKQINQNCWVGTPNKGSNPYHEMRLLPLYWILTELF